MKKTTIFRSRLGIPLVAVLALAGLVLPSLGGSIAAAQQPPAQPAAAAQPARPTAPVPASHVVEKGETLWGLAQQFLGDPLLWPEIYRLNTTVIEDPHWIFPGEELHLIGGAQTASAAPAGAAAPAAESAAAPAAVAVAPAPAEAQPAQAAAPGAITVSPTAVDTDTSRAAQGPVLNPATGPTIFSNQGHVGSSQALQRRELHAYRAVRSGEYYSAGFILEPGEQLTSGTLVGNSATSSISRLTTTNSAMLYGTVVVTPPPGDSLKPGDLLLSYDTPRVVEDYGTVVRPTGLLKVTRVGEPGDNAMAQVVGVFQSIDGGQKVMRVTPFQSKQGVRPDSVPEGSGVQGQVIDLRSPREVVNEQDMLFIDKGLADGVHLGDIFQVSRTAPPTSGVGEIVQKQAQILIVYARDHNATGLVIQVDRPDIRPGSTVRQIRRMPS